MQTVATLLLHGTSNVVSCERSVIAAVPPSGGQRVDSGATNGSDGVDLIQDVKLPGRTSYMPVFRMGQLGMVLLDLQNYIRLHTQCNIVDYDGKVATDVRTRNSMKLKFAYSLILMIWITEVM